MRSFLAALLSLCACGAPAAAPAAPAPSTCADSTPPPPSPKKEEPAPEPKTSIAPSPALKDALAAAEKAIAANDMATADQKIAAAESATGDDVHLQHMVARMKATRFVYAADFDRAGAALLAVIPSLAKHPELSDEFWAHNTMMMIREAQGDPASALG